MMMRASARGVPAAVTSRADRDRAGGGVGGEVRVAEVVGYALADADEPDDLLAPASASASAAAVERAR